jgi:O-antigen/teichoic acid export membrane protein
MTSPTPSTDAARPVGGSRRRVAKNLGASGAVSFAKVGIQLILLPVMAHLLGPSEFGLYALALPAVLFFMVIADGGLGISLAREDESNTLVWSTAFWALLGIGIILAGVVALWGIVLAGLAHQPRLSTIMGILSITFVFVALSVVPAARLTRRGNLVTSSGADLTGTIIGAVTAVTLASLGMGALSLAFQSVCSSATRTLILNVVAYKRPSWQFQFSTIRHHISTGSYLISGRLVDFACRFTENLLIGRFFGPAALGTYTFGNQVPRFVNEAVSNPTWTVFYAQALHETPSSLASLYYRLSRLMALATFPAAFILSASAPQVLMLFLDPKWADAAVFIQILAPSYALYAVSTLSGAVLLADGHNKGFLATFALSSFGRVLAASSGIWLSPIGVVWAIFVSNLVYAAVMILIGARLMAFTPLNLVRALIPPIAASAVGAVLCYVALHLQNTTFAGTIASIALGVVGFLVMLIILQGPTLKADLLTLKRMVIRSPSAE